VNPSPARHDVRYKLLKLLHAEFVRLNNLAKAAPGKDDTQVFTDQELIARALDREEQLAKEKGTLFTSAMKHLVMRYKKMTLKAWLDDLAAEKEAILAEERARAEERNNAARPPILGPPKVIKTNLTPAQEVAVVRARLLTPIDKHAAHGYIPSAPTQQQIVKARSGTKSAGGWEKCERCGQRFQTFPGRRYDGKLVSGGQCKHHWGKAYFPARGPGQMAAKDKVWSCCSTTYGDSSGCSESATHVFKTSDPARLATLLEFAETPENPNVPSDRAVAFDCEMGFTVLGLEMIRLTATAWPTGEALLDVLVRPYGEILDLNSTFSGVWPQDITNAKLWVSPGLPPVPTATLSDPMPATTSADEAAALASTRPVMSMVSTPAHARALLFSLISPSTPLIGHGLENDLNACRIIHPTIVDTVLVFPHRNGLPMRNGLRALAERHLNRSIQSSAAQGHDSAEDARAAGDLVRLRVSEMWPHMDNTGWRFDEDGTLLDPVAAKKKGGVKLKVEEELVEKPAAEKEDKKVKKKSGIPEKLAPLDADW
jgi:RNA exonuclease 1